MTNALPALSLIAMPGRRARTLELATQLDNAGFTGLWCPSYGDCMALCQALAGATTNMVFGTSIQPIYWRRAQELAGQSAFIHEVSGGRFRLGLGVSHGPSNERLGLQTGKPLTDIRAYVESIKATEKQHGPGAPIVLATLRDKMLDLALEIGEGAVWANASLKFMPHSVGRVPAARKDSFFLGNMIPTVIDDDRDAARGINRRTMLGYVTLPNYRNYWKAAGYTEEMEAIEAALAKGDRDSLPGLMPDRWLDDVTLSGSATQVREGVEAWQATGVTPILVPSAVTGGQMKAFDDVLAAYAK